MLRDGLIGRGVLLDVPRLREVPWLEPGQNVFTEDLEDAERSQGVTVGEGDILLVRTGHTRRQLERGAWDSDTARAGLHPTVARFLAERRVAALGCDGNNDTAPSTTESIDFPIHALALNAMGIHLLDYLRLEDLGAACDREGRWEFMFAAAPLRLVGGTGSPLNPDRDSVNDRRADPHRSPRTRPVAERRNEGLWMGGDSDQELAALRTAADFLTLGCGQRCPPLRFGGGMFRATHGPGIRLKALPGGPVNPTDRFRWKLCSVISKTAECEAKPVTPRLLPRRHQSADQPKQGKDDPNDEHHPVALADGHEAQGQEQDEVEDAAENEEHLDSPLQVVGGRYVSP